MNKLTKFPILSLAMVLLGYIAYGWLLSIHGADWRIWIPLGAIAFAAEWIFSVAWAIAAVLFIFIRKEQFLLSLGVTVIWASLMYIARLELRAYFLNNRNWSLIILALIAGIGLGLGWFTDTLPMIRTFGNSLIK